MLDEFFRDDLLIRSTTLVFCLFLLFDEDIFSFSMRRNLGVMVLVFLLGIVVSLALFMSSRSETQPVTTNFQQTQLAQTQLLTQETHIAVTEWEDFHDHDFGYSLKLPKEMEVFNHADDFIYYESLDGQALDEHTICMSFASKPGCQLSIALAFNPQELPLEEYYRLPEKPPYLNSGNYEVLRTYQVYQTIPVRLAYEVKDINKHQVITLVPHKKLIYEITDTFLNEKDHHFLIESLTFDSNQEPIISDYFSYRLVNYFNGNSVESGCEDNKLYRFNEAGNKELIFESVIEQITYPAFVESKKQHCNLALLKEVYAPTKGKLIFRAGYMETDAPSFGLFSFDTRTQKFSYMKINEYYPAFGVDAESADGLKQLAIEREGVSPGKKLYLLDLVNDSVRVLVQLNKGETLLGQGGFGQMYGDVTFFDDRTVSYAVYEGDSILDESGYDEGHSFLTTRQIKF